MKKRLIISVTSDLVTDQRVHKVSQTLHEEDFEVLLIGRKMKKSLSLPPRDYDTRRLELWFSKTVLFYMNYNLRLFILLLFTKADILLANDLDTLPANFFISKLKRIPLIYDSHEYFTGVPELQNRPFVRKIWEKIERLIFPELKSVYTVNNSIARLYREQYNKDIRVVRNVPNLVNTNEALAGYPSGKAKIILYQGSGINMNRGVEELVLSMKYLDAQEFQLWIAGGGDVYDELKILAAAEHLQDRIRFIQKVPFNELRKITVQAHLGVSIDKPTNINYLYSLPNKVFDYIHAGLPLLVSALPEIKGVLEKYSIGSFIDNHEPKHIATKIQFMFTDKERYIAWKRNTETAKKDLCWQKESLVIKDIFRPYKIKN